MSPNLDRNIKTSEQVARRIIGDIVEQGLNPGEMLPPEAVMLQNLGVGRPTLREALRILEVSGLLTLRPGPGGGPIVGEVAPRDFARMMTMFLQMGGVTLRELLESRRDLEPMIAGLAARNISDDGRRQLMDALTAHHKIDLNDDSEYTQSGLDFHSAIVHLAGNRPLQLIAEGLNDVFVTRVDREVYPLRERRRVIREHAEIADAVSRGDEAEATTLMRKHLDHYMQSVIRRHPVATAKVIAWG